MNKIAWGKSLEYVMPRNMYESLRNEAPKNVNAKDWVIEYVNETFGLLGTVTEIRIEG